MQHRHHDRQDGEQRPNPDRSSGEKGGGSTTRLGAVSDISATILTGATYNANSLNFGALTLGTTTILNTSATNADLYTVQYVPLLHPDATNPDDRIDLTNKVFASASGTTVASFSGQNAAPGNHDFYVINSSSDATKQILVTGFLNAANAIGFH